MLWCSYFRSFIKSVNLDRCGNFIKKFNFVSTPWKIIIPIAHHPPYHPLNTPSPMPPPTLPPPPITSLTSTPHTTTPTHPTTTPNPPPPTPPIAPVKYAHYKGQALLLSHLTGQAGTCMGNMTKICQIFKTSS